MTCSRLDYGKDLAQETVNPGSWFSFKTLIYLGLTAKIIKNKVMGKQNQSQSLRDWCEVCVGGDVPTSSSNASHTTSLTDGLSN